MLNALNQPCGSLREVPSDWADAIVTSPPYNLGHGAPDDPDMLTQRAYCAMLATLLTGCNRATKPLGVLAIDVADWIKPTAGRQFALAEFVKKTAREAGFFIMQEIGYRAIAADGSEACRGHSEFQHILLFSKNPGRIPVRSRMSASYLFGVGESEVFWPKTHVQDLFDTLDLGGKSLVEPFAGSAKIIEMTLASGGDAIAYEKSAHRFDLFLAPLLRDYQVMAPSP